MYARDLTESALYSHKYHSNESTDRLMEHPSDWEALVE